MIVKNEAPVIRRCLSSVRPILDHWIIVDTGSSDGTQDLIREALHDLPGALIERPWVDFAYNRSEALALARPHGRYSLVIDADDELIIPAEMSLPELVADSYSVDITDGVIAYWRRQLFANALPWRYEGVLHEYPVCEAARSTGHLPMVMRRNHDGARRRDPSTYVKDAAVLERALAVETDAFKRVRYTFYLAQSYRDCGENEKALEAYRARAALGGWDQEVFVSLYQAGKMMEALGHPLDAIADMYRRASAACPSRVEAAHAASRLLRLADRFKEGYAIAKAALGTPASGDGLFVERWIEAYGLLDEFAVNAYWSGHYRDCLDACLRALESGTVPAGEQPRFLRNMRFALDKLAEDAAAPASRAGQGFHADRPPRVLLAILAKQKETVLPLYLQCIERLDYPKAAITLHVRTNNNTDRTADILRAWLSRVSGDYAHVAFDDADVDARVEAFGVHEWNATRFKVLAQIRDASLRKTLEHGCDFYFVADVDNFLAARTLRDLVALNLPIVAPMLRHVEGTSRYSNFHADIDRDGYFVETPLYDAIVSRTKVGVFEVPVVHCTYLVRADRIGALRYDDGSDRHEYVVFSDSARRAGISQHLDNRHDYGFLTLDDDTPGLIADQIERVARALGLEPRPVGEDVAEARRAFEAIYSENVWGQGSGPGSHPANTIEYRAFLERFMEANGVRSVTDLGCGDWQSTGLIDWAGIAYTGLDVVEAVVNANRARHAGPTITFDVLRSIDDLPGGDLLIAKEVLQHLPNTTIMTYIAAIRRTYRFALLTNSVEPATLANQDITVGGYRPLRLDEAPFSIPGARVFVYHSQAGGYIWKNVVYLLIGSPSKAEDERSTSQDVKTALAS